MQRIALNDHVAGAEEYLAGIDEHDQLAFEEDVVVERGCPVPERLHVRLPDRPHDDGRVV